MKKKSMLYYNTDYIPAWQSFIFGAIGGSVGTYKLFADCALY